MQKVVCMIMHLILALETVVSFRGCALGFQKFFVRDLFIRYLSKRSIHVMSVFAYNVPYTCFCRGECVGCHRTDEFILLYPNRPLTCSDGHTSIIGVFEKSILKSAIPL